MAYDVTIYPSDLQGEVTIPPSKSMLHRALIGAALAKGESKITPFRTNRDIGATIRALKTLGASFRKSGKDIFVTGIDKPDTSMSTADVTDSASTLRLLIPVMALFEQPTKFLLSEGLSKRPMEPYMDIFPDALSHDEEGNLHVKASLDSGHHSIDGQYSSQFVSGMLFALPLLKEDSFLEIVNPSSQPYIDLTIDVLKHFGIKIDEAENGYRIPGNQKFKSRDIKIEGDFSQASLFMVAGLKHRRISVTPLEEKSLQGDKTMIPIIKRSGGTLEFKDSRITTSQSQINGFEASIKDSPDLAPALALLGSLSKERCVINDVKRLEYKESNRAFSIMENLRAFGVNIYREDDAIIIEGTGKVSEDLVLDGHNDHRIIMMSAMAATWAKRPTKILNAHYVKKSYPDFFEDLERLGAKIKHEERDTDES
ncbi:MAG: 3-phosphoshikimate 1-carboxyvinyltransferase [Bacillota bacterium]